ncbi:MAG: metal ABC transporter substrate-binding protein, partial [Lachnospiraceae bacterium]|nr:metal ABC transporter substrate-binding protein [Lachnospiraceae bacterium]
MKLKKVYILVAAVIITALCFCGCGNADTAAKDDGLNIVTTIFPEYDWVVNILGENPAGAEVTMLLDNGVDLHSYQPTAEDIVKISTCDIFIYVGGESDEWVEDALN